jgi:hypothetical protein
MNFLFYWFILDFFFLSIWPFGPIRAFSQGSKKSESWLRQIPDSFLLPYFPALSLSAKDNHHRTLIIWNPDLWNSEFVKAKFLDSKSIHFNAVTSLKSSLSLLFIFVWSEIHSSIKFTILSCTIQWPQYIQKEAQPLPLFIFMHWLTTVIGSEKCVSRQFFHNVNTVDYT